MNKNELEYWNSYLETLEVIPENLKVEVGIAGNPEIADELLNLYLNGKKTAGSSLVKDYELAKDPLPEVGNFWMILDSKSEPKCIVKTVRVKYYQFDQVPQEVAYAEGEGDLSLDHWKKAHREFFTPFLKEWGISDLDKETVVTEFYEVVYK
jgi:5-formyltetrahydrofolate cyclo-ligase